MMRLFMLIRMFLMIWQGMLIDINHSLESFREYSKEELAQYEKMKSYFESKE